MNASHRAWTDPDDPKRVILELEPGRCSRFWDLFFRGEQDYITAHLKTCPSCRQWAERSRVISEQLETEHDVVLERTE